MNKNHAAKGAAAVAIIVAGLTVGGDPLREALTRWEGRELKVYADKLANGLPTVCGGHTDWKLRVGSAYTKEDCDRIDAITAKKYGLAIIACTGHTETHRVLNQHQFDALSLFAINVGIAGACGSRAVTLIKQGRYTEGCKSIANGPSGKPVWSYVNGGKRFVQGLYNRRLFERDWCLKPVIPAPQEESAAA